jgi:uncharacterized membrane protein
MGRAAQTVSQVGLHVGVAFGVMYALTGSIALGGVAALVEPVCNVALLPLHDKMWRKVRERFDRSRSRTGARPGAVPAAA